eukprot:c156_g1_i2 orf=634-1011(+)
MVAGLFRCLNSFGNQRSWDENSEAVIKVLHSIFFFNWKEELKPIVPPWQVVPKEEVQVMKKVPSGTSKKPGWWLWYFFFLSLYYLRAIIFALCYSRVFAKLLGQINYSVQCSCGCLKKEIALPFL